MNQLSLRGFDKERGAGLLESPGAPASVGNALDGFIGRWSEAEERRFLASIASCETVDETLWK